MASVAELLFLFRAEAGEAKRTIKEVGHDVENLQKKGRNPLSAIAMVGGAVAATAAFGGLVAAVGYGADAFAKAQAANAQLQQALKDTGQAIPKDHLETYDAGMRKIGQTDTDAEISLTKLVQAQIPANSAMKDMGVVADFAAARHMSLADATDMLAKGANGRLNPALKEMGVHLAKGEHGAAAFDSIIQQLGPHVAGAASAQAGTFSGSMDKLKASFDHVAVSVGAKVAPVLEKVANWFSDHSQQIGDFVNTTLNALGQAFQWIGDNVIPPLVAAFKQVSDWAQQNKPMLRQVADVLVKVLGFAVGFLGGEIQFWAKVWTTSFTIVYNVIKAVVTAVVAVFQVLQTAWGVVSTVFKAGATVIGFIFNGVKDSISLDVGLILGIFHGLSSALSAIWNGIAGGAKTGWNAITGAIKTAINFIIGAVNGVIGMLNAVQIHVPAVGVGPVHTPAFDWNGLHIGKIKPLALGATVNQATLGIFGEAGREHVVPDLAMNKLLQTAALYGAQSGGGGDHIVINNPSSEFDAARMIESRNWLKRMDNRGITRPALIPLEAG